MEISSIFFSQTHRHHKEHSHRHLDLLKSVPTDMEISSIVFYRHRNHQEWSHRHVDHLKSVPTDIGKSSDIQGSPRVFPQTYAALKVCLRTNGDIFDSVPTDILTYSKYFLQTHRLAPRVFTQAQRSTQKPWQAHRLPLGASTDKENSPSVLPQT